MMIPCHFLTMMIHRHFYQAGYTSDHSTCPYRFLRHRGDSIILPPPWFNETLPPSSTIHEDVLPPTPSFDETPFETAPVPDTPTTPTVAKRWRSGTLHLENPVSKRWRSGTLHPETPVPTTTPPQLRWRAGVLRASRPFRRLRDRQSDPSEAV